MLFRSDDIIKMAREAGDVNCDCCLPFYEEQEQPSWEEFFIRFAQLVAEHEREACAQVCENIDSYEDRYEPEKTIAAAIRGRTA